MTPDVPRLREMLDEPQTGLTLAPGPLAMWIGALHQRQNRMIRALLSSAPPDGAAEREANDLECGRCDGDGFEPSTHSRNACSLCGGSGRLPTPAPTEAPAAGDGGEGFTDAAFAAYNRWVSTQEMAPSGYPAFFAGAEWAAALARPAAVTDEMVEAFCLSFHGERWLKWLEEIKAQYRADAGVHLTAALAARGPA